MAISIKVTANGVQVTQDLADMSALMRNPQPLHASVHKALSDRAGELQRKGKPVVKLQIPPPPLPARPLRPELPARPAKPAPLARPALAARPVPPSRPFAGRNQDPAPLPSQEDAGHIIRQGLDRAVAPLFK